MARLMTVQGWVPEHLLPRHPLHTAAMALQEWLVREGGWRGGRVESGKNFFGFNQLGGH